MLTDMISLVDEKSSHTLRVASQSMIRYQIFYLSMSTCREMCDQKNRALRAHPACTQQ
jgi:hypothetical protein